MKELKLTERAVQNALFWMLRQKGHQMIVPNYTPSGWWECDVASVTAAGSLHEYEVKLTVPDFRADAAKSMGGERVFDRETRKWGKSEVLMKRFALEHGAAQGPQRFYYVLPNRVVEDAEVPEFAGIIRIFVIGRRIVLTEARKPATLHREKVPAHVLEHMRSVFYHRYWRLRTKTGDAEPEIETNETLITTP